MRPVTSRRLRSPRSRLRERAYRVVALDLPALVHVPVDFRLVHVVSPFESVAADISAHGVSATSQLNSC